MIKKRKSISITIISALLLLTCLFAYLILPTNSWFSTSHSEGIKVTVKVAALNLNVYQDSVTSSNLLTTLDDAEAETPRYINLPNGKVLPDTAMDLKLIASNTSAGAVAMYIRFKVQLYALTYSGNTLIPCEVSRTTETENASSGTFELENDGYYYFRNNGENVKLAINASETLMEKIVIPQSSFNNNGNMLIDGGETLKIVVTIEGSIANTF